MITSPDSQTDAQYMQHPLIRQIAEMTDMVTDSCLTIVYPDAAGWKQTQGKIKSHPRPAFCSMIQTSEEGAKHCRMCHIMMTVAACSGEAAEQQCHAGATVLVCSASQSSDESMAVLSSCLFSSEEAWEAVRRRGEKLGLNLTRLRKAFMSLPKMNKKQLQTLKTAMQTMGYALQIVRQNRQLSAQVSKLNHAPDQISILEQFLANSAWATASRAEASATGGYKPLLIHVVCELMQQRPDFPLTVKELAAAARLTPNHFSTLFSEQMGIPFNEYLTEQRVQRARKLLQNPTLTISEVARLAGYDDPGYFTRRFRQKTGLSPREWRNQLPGSP